MVKSRDELLEQIKTSLGDSTDDSALTLLEDITDTLNDYETRVSVDGIDWKQKYEENDEKWRQKYRDRFYNSSSTDDNIDDSGEEDKPLTYENLFKEKE